MQLLGFVHTEAQKSIFFCVGIRYKPIVIGYQDIDFQIQRTKWNFSTHFLLTLLMPALANATEPNGCRHKRHKLYQIKMNGLS